MRVLVALLSAAAILAVTWVYQRTLADGPVASSEPPPPQIVAEYRIAVTATFDAGLDPFAEEVDSGTTLTVSHLGKVLLAVDRPIPAGETNQVELEMALPAGRHEFLIEMSPANPSELKPKAVQVELFRGGAAQPIQTQVLWADTTASRVVGGVTFDVHGTSRTDDGT